MLTETRNRLVEEGRSSPTLLSDLAGLEAYVAETYDARSFIELLQNADDVCAGRFAIIRDGAALLVANDGRLFTAADFESLCRSAASNKQRGDTIGYRGIGFKSVVGLARTVHLFSGELEATFSRELTALEIPQASRVPLVRIPHPVAVGTRSAMEPALQQLRADGFKTIFVFGDLVANSIETEFEAFDPTSLLFLRHVRQVELKGAVESITTVRRSAVDNHTRSLRLATASGVSEWTLLDKQEVTFAFRHDESGIARLDERQAVVHAFLPSLEATGFPFKVNGDISTDPSRTRIVLDERTSSGIGLAAQLIVELAEECLGGTRPDGGQLLATLVPHLDPRMAVFQRRCFKTELVAAVQREAKGRFEDLLLRPAWLNPADFETQAQEAGLRFVGRQFDGIEGLAAFLKFLGAKEAKLQDLSDSLKTSAPTVTGAAEVVAHLSNLHATKQIETAGIDPEWKVWPSEEAPVSLSEAREDAKPLTDVFVDLVTEKSGSEVALKRLVTDLTDSTTAAQMVPGTTAQATPFQLEGVPAVSSPPIQVSLKRWRAAEQQVLAVLVARGWRAEDVSRQNIGYDIEGRQPSGEPAFVEVKSLDYPSQPFTLTSNEEAVAREKGKFYWLALVRLTPTHFELALLNDPASHLKFIRQCRQWVWECSEYQFQPEKFPVE